MMLSIIGGKPINKQFSEWFVGFSDADSNFTIRSRKNPEGVIKGFEFIFRIALHKDDKKTLEYIQSKLGCGIIRVDRNNYVLIINKNEDIELKLLPIFDSFNLNSVKDLDYLAWREGFLLWRARKKLTPSLITQILELKDSMNANRKDFTMPLGHVRITENYILGLIEGDGSFYLYKSKYYTYISIGMESVNRFLFEKIRHYLIKQMDFYSQLYAINTKLIAIVDQK